MNPVSQSESLQLIENDVVVLSKTADRCHVLLMRAWSALKWIGQRAKAQQARKNLRVCENISLGEKRFVAIVQVDDERFLIGGSSGSVSLLTRLQEAKTFAADLERAAGMIS